MNLLTTASAIAAEVDRRLKTITQANGYETNIGATTFRGKLRIEDSLVPCGVLIEGSDTVEARPGRIPQCEIAQSYVIGGYVPCDPDNPNDAAHAVLRDIKRSVFSGNANLDGRVKIVRYKGRDIGPRADGQPIVFAVVELEVEYVEDLTKP